MVGGGGGVAPLKLIQLYSLCMFTFYNVNILKCESLLIALRRNSKKWTFLLHKILKCRLF